MVKKNKITHKERVEKVKDFAGNNKVFTVIAVIITVFLLANFIFSKVNQSEKTSLPRSENSQNAVNEDAENQPQTSKIPKWEFHWLDLWIFAGVGGFCVIMIVRERKKAREELQ